MKTLTIRSRTITQADIAEIQSTVTANWDCSRTEISRILCRKWGWLQPNGHLKDMACREILVTLERKGLIQLPPGCHDGRNSLRNRSIPHLPVEDSPISGSLADLEPISLVLARNTPIEPLYNSLIHRYHYLGYRQIVGSHLKYIAFIGKRPVACLGWGSAAWRVRPRDELIGWDRETRAKNLHLVVNNTRFLVLPWVDVKCMASRVLSICVKRIASDWQNVYRHPIHLLETFVQKDRFKGTCYRAANWAHIGVTRGVARRGLDNLFHGRIKDVYLYPLGRKWRSWLCRRDI